MLIWEKGNHPKLIIVDETGSILMGSNDEDEIQQRAFVLSVVEQKSIEVYRSTNYSDWIDKTMHSNETK